MKILLDKRLFLLLIFPTLVFSQDLEISPYSVFGLGESKYQGPTESLSMGGLNSIYWNNIQVNPSNPATYSYLDLTNITFGVQGKVVNLQTEKQAEKNSDFGVSQLIFGVPAGKYGGLAFGFVPISSTGYDLVSKETIVDKKLEITDGTKTLYDGSYSNVYRFKGSGGINSFFIGASVKPFKGFSIGVNANYEFGNLKRSVNMITPPVYKKINSNPEAPESLVFEASQYGTNEVELLILKNWNFLFGIVYTGKFKEDWQYTLGATYGLSNKVKLDYTRNISTFIYGSKGEIIPKDTLQSLDNDYINDIELPASGSAGFSIGKFSNWMVGVNYEFKDPTQLSFGNESFNIKYKQKKTYSMGGYWIPKYNSEKSYIKRITYRAGFNYEETGLNINDIDIVDYSINFGFGFPLKNGVSNINFGGAFGTRGTVDMNLIKENYFKFILSFSLSDRWFRKVKYN